MRIALIASLILACGLATPVLAQSAPAADHGKDASSAAPAPKTEDQAPARVQASNPEADAALAIAIRQREARERLLQMACAAGDTSKCQPANASTTASTPSP